MKSPTCAVYKVNRDTGFNDNSPYDAYCAPPGLHTATYNRKTGEWVVYQPLTDGDASPDALIMVAWVDEVRWFESGCSAVTSNLTSNLTSKEIL